MAKGNTNQLTASMELSTTGKATPDVKLLKRMSKCHGVRNFMTAFTRDRLSEF
jgi:hypothetical protein